MEVMGSTMLARIAVRLFGRKASSGAALKTGRKHSTGEVCQGLTAFDAATPPEERFVSESAIGALSKPNWLELNPVPMVASSKEEPRHRDSAQRGDLGQLRIVKFLLRG